MFERYSSVTRGSTIHPNTSVIWLCVSQLPACTKDTKRIEAVKMFRRGETVGFKIQGALESLPDATVWHMLTNTEQTNVSLLVIVYITRGIIPELFSTFNG